MPSGTLTFLFTDVIGSTRLWEQDAEAMRRALGRHDRLLREQIEAQGGRVFKTIGDAFCAAFERADEALRAAIAIQVGLAEAPQQPGEPRLEVRAALHSGAAEERDQDYFGPSLNRCARLLEIGHGRQVLLSAAVRELLRASLPETVTLEDLGRHRLRDLGAPEQVFQARHEGLPTRYPPLASLDARPNNLPIAGQGLIGREAELEAVSALLERSRLVTLTGAGGSGKTRLSLQVAAERMEAHPDGLWFVELATIEDGRRIPAAIADAIGLREEPGRDLLETLLAQLADQETLLVLDNCEHLIEDCAALAARILAHCPRARILASSREGLRIAGESLYPVPPLGLPRPRGQRQPMPEWLEQVAASASVQLFVERALAAQPDFTLSDRNADAVVEICRRLDGVALALELAAARVRVLSPAQIAERLDNHLRLLTGGRRGVLPRQQTMRAAVEWSYELLDAQERQLLERLSVFAGGWSLELAEQICADASIEAWEVLDLLGRLVEKSLVVADTDAEASRYRMLETIRLFAQERLEVAGEAARRRLALLEALRELALQAEPELSGPSQVDWLDRLHREHDNLSAALGFAREAGHAQPGLVLAASLMRYWQLRGHLTEGLAHLRALLECAEPEAITDSVRAKSHNAAGALAYYQGDFEAALKSFEASLAIWQGLGDAERIDQLISNLGVISRSLGDIEAARSYLRRSLATNRERGDGRGIALALWNLSLLDLEEGRLDEALQQTEESLSIQRAQGEQLDVADLLCTQAEILWLMGRDLEALGAAEESLERYREAGTDFGEAEALEILAKIESDAGRLEAAQGHIAACLAARRELGDAQGIADALICLGGICLRAGQGPAAAAALEEGLAKAQTVGFKRGVANGLLQSARLRLQRDELEVAAALLREVLPLIGSLGSRLLLASALEILAALAHARGEHDEARRLLFSADTLRAACGAPRPRWLSEALQPLVDAAAGAPASERIEDVTETLPEDFGSALGEAIRYIG